MISRNRALWYDVLNDYLGIPMSAKTSLILLSTFGLIAYLMFFADLPEARDRSLDEIAFDETPHLKKKEVCLEGALYLKDGWTPSTPVLDASGSGAPCSEDSRSLNDFERTYQPICRSGIRYIRFPGKYSTFFVKIDGQTLKPEACGD